MSPCRASAPIPLSVSQAASSSARSASHEDQRLLAFHAAELAEENVALVGIADQHGALADGIDRFAGAFGLDRHRIGQEGFGKPFHLVRHRGREEDGLAGLRQRLENAPDRRQEAQIDHLVALIEDEMFDIRQIDLAAGHQILETPRVATSTSTPFFSDRN